MAKALAEVLFDDESALIRLIVIEYGEIRNSRLNGAPPGYVGYEKVGELTKVRSKPYSKVL